jgi:hypothetical protein
MPSRSGPYLALATHENKVEMMYLSGSWSIKLAEGRCSALLRCEAGGPGVSEHERGVCGGREERKNRVLRWLCNSVAFHG